MFESAPRNELPEEINIEEQKFQTNAQGKKYLYEKDGTYYGGDYLAELPEEIDLNFPAAPKEESPIVI